MKIETYKKFSAYTRKMSDGTYKSFNYEALCVRVRCDVCSSSLEYEGTRPQAAQKLKDAGWRVGATGIVRCPACASALATRMRGSIGRTH